MLFFLNTNIFPRSSGFLLHLKVFIKALSMIPSGDYFKKGEGTILILLKDIVQKKLLNLRRLIFSLSRKDNRGI
jgi:hypothetical protein